jgi:hypothetical protein
MGFDSVLTLMGGRVWRHFKSIGKTAPARIDIRGPDDEFVAWREIDGVDQDNPNE